MWGNVLAEYSNMLNRKLGRYKTKRSGMGPRSTFDQFWGPNLFFEKKKKKKKLSGSGKPFIKGHQSVCGTLHYYYHSYPSSPSFLPFPFLLLHHIVLLFISEEPLWVSVTFTHLTITLTRTLFTFTLTRLSASSLSSHSLSIGTGDTNPANSLGHLLPGLCRFTSSILESNIEEM